MSHFDLAIETVLEHEGGFVDHESDPGGATKYGVSLRFLRSIGQDIDRDGDIDLDDVKALTIAEAKSIYHRHFWNQLYDELLDYGLAEKLFDFAVNMGTRRAVTLLQQGLNLCRRSNPVHEDGVFGPVTLLAANQTQSALHLLEAEAARFYFELTERDESRRVFLTGWLRRAYA